MKWDIPYELKIKIKSLYNLLPGNFDYKTYLLLHPDLGEAGITSEEEAIEHYILFGKREGRICYDSRPETHNTIVKNITIDNKINKYKKINSLFDAIYIISLRKNNNRKIIKKYFDQFNISFKFIDAIDGNLNQDIINYYNDYLSWPIGDSRRHYLDSSNERRVILGPGAIGLSLTYKKIFEQAIDNNYKQILIFEEDCLFDKDINIHLHNFMKFKSDFDLLFLGASHHSWNDPKILEVPNTTTNYYLAPHVMDGTFAIAYNCKILPDIIEEIEKMNSPIDSGPIRSILKNNNSYVLYPNVAIADTTPKSSISGRSRNLRNHRYNVHWDLSNIAFNRATLKISIIMANHNGELTIERSIKSVLSQTYQNFELIIIDDASTDSSIDIIKKYCKQDNRIVLIKSEKNIGAYACRNIGLKHSSGFFITILDSDDIFLSKKLEIDIYNYFNFNQYDIFFSNMYRSRNINLNKLHSDKSINKAIKNEREPHLFSEDSDNYVYGHNSDWEYKLRFGLPTIFVEKAFFDKYGVWNETYKYGMDLELIQRYIAIKYNEFIDDKSLWNMIYLYQGSKYAINLSETTNYVSFPQNENNATIKCSTNDREIIHSKCNKKLKQLVKKSYKIKSLSKNNITEIFCMIKNEEDILKYFIEYHINMVDSLTIIDNGSSDSSLNIAKQYPIKLIQNNLEFKNKSLIISDLMRNSKADLLIPLDVDEFLLLEKYNKKIFNKKQIKNYLSNLKYNAGDKFQIKHIYEKYPDKNSFWDLNPTSTKMIFPKEGFLAVDTGFHKGSTTTNNIKPIDISYCHFHFRSKNKWIQNTKQKLQSRLGDDWNNIEALKQYTGESDHCAREWIRFIETGQWHNLRPKVKFRFLNKMVFD